MSGRGPFRPDAELDDGEDAERQPWGDPDADEPYGQDESADAERSENVRGGSGDDR